MAEFRYGRVLLRHAAPGEAGTHLSHSELGELEDELAPAADDSMSRRDLARFLGTTIVYSAEHLLEVLREHVVAGRVIITRERARTIDGDAGLDPTTLRRLAATPEDLADDQAHSIAIQLIGEDDEPIAGVRYRLVDPEGRTVEGRTGPDGRAVVWGLARAGQCRVTFPDLDRDAWDTVDSVPL